VSLFYRQQTETKMKYLNLILMVAMALLAVREVLDIVQHGPSTTNVLFAVLFATFAIRRFLLIPKYSRSEQQSGAQPNL